MSARSILTLAIVAAGVLAPAANADAAKVKTASIYPTIAKVSPMRASIGDTMTITGRGFLKGKAKNTVVFRRQGKRSVFVKADGVSTTRLRFKLPEKLRPVLGSDNTRFQLRVLARRFGKSYTPLGRSPVVTGRKTASPATPRTPAAATPAGATVRTDAPAANCDGDSLPDAQDPDDDNDLLPDTLESSIGTDACKLDTDGDGMEDGWEYQSARDLNRESCPAAEFPAPCAGAKPYPSKTPYTNPRFADHDEDYDGDFLPAWFEHRAWKLKGVRSLDNLWYSDGLQASRDSGADGCRGLAEATITGQVDQYPTGQTTSSHGGAVTPRYAWLYGRSDYTLDSDAPTDPGYGCLSDDERDEDGDFLSNSVELNGVMSGRDFFSKRWSEPAFKTEYAGTDVLDADSDGDGNVDGIDDQDFDDFWNVEEVTRGTRAAREPNQGETPPANLDYIDDGVRSGLWTDPYNPCLPAIYSRTCPRALLIEAEPWRPFTKNTSDAKPPVERWPLYDTALYSGYTAGTELWDALPGAEQTLPPRQPDAIPGNAGAEHPLPRPQ